jgi:hypothetical protein
MPQEQNLTKPPEKPQGTIPPRPVPPSPPLSQSRCGEADGCPDPAPRGAIFAHSALARTMSLSTRRAPYQNHQMIRLRRAATHRPDAVELDLTVRDHFAGAEVH